MQRSPVVPLVPRCTTGYHPRPFGSHISVSTYGVISNKLTSRPCFWIDMARVAVHELAGFESVDGCLLFFSTGTWDKGTHVLREHHSFGCQLRPVIWHNIEGLLEPVAGPATGGSHQWLDRHGDIHLLISDDAGW